MARSEGDDLLPPRSSLEYDGRVVAISPTVQCKVQGFGF